MTMKIHELFIKPVERPIDGVIKADDARNLQTELEEYVSPAMSPWDWISSPTVTLTSLPQRRVDIRLLRLRQIALLKILSLILDGHPSPSGTWPADVSAEDRGRDREVPTCARPPPSRLAASCSTSTRSSMASAAIIPPRFWKCSSKVLNELQGYYGKQGYIAKFEHDLDMRGDFGPFKETYLRVERGDWEKTARPWPPRKAAFAKAYAAHFGVAEAEASNLMRQVREDYRFPSRASRRW
jgi:hypothetical protein